jgi:hypothetical protein
MSPMKRVALFPLIAIAILCMLFAIVPTLKQAWYDAQTLQSRHQLQQWLSAPQQELAIEDWIKARENLSSASQACPNVALYHIELARLHVLRAVKAYRAPAVRDIFYEQAIAHYRMALQVQPNSATSMANIAQFKAYLGQNDAEFAKLFSQAQRLSPYEADIQLALLNAGFQSWAKLNPEMRNKMRQIQQIALTQQKENYLKLKNNYPQIEL